MTLNHICDYISGFFFSSCRNDLSLPSFIKEDLCGGSVQLTDGCRAALLKWGGERAQSQVDPSALLTGKPQTPSVDPRWYRQIETPLPQLIWISGVSARLATQA